MVGKKKSDCMLPWENRMAKQIYPNRNGMVWYLSVSTHTLGLLHSKCGVGWGVGLLAVKVCMLISFCFYHVTCMASGVTVSIHCFACWSTLEAILFSWSLHLLLDPGFRVSPAQLHKALSFSWYMVPVTLFFSKYKGNVYSKNQHIPH